MLEPIASAVSAPMTPHDIDQAKRNKRLAWIHVGIALLVLAIFVANTVSQ